MPTFLRFKDHHKVCLAHIAAYTSIMIISKKIQMQGAKKLWSDEHLSRISRDNDEVEAQRHRWTFYETINYDWP